MTEPDDFDLFRAETKGIKPIKQDTFVAPRQKSSQKKSPLRDIREKEDTLFYFSDEYEPLLNEHDGVIKYLREGEDSHLLKQLRRGDFSPELFLDLHGLTREQAKMELAALLLACEDEHVYCASIMKMCIRDRQYTLPVSEGVVCQTANEAEMALFQLNGDVWIAKCQVHSGGRGKAGGVKLVHNAEEVRAFADKWLGQHLVTFQTDKKGQPVNSIYIEETCQIDKELYLGAVIDRASQKVIFMASSAGGMSIEDVARETPELIHKVTIDPLVGGMPYQGRELAFKLGLSGEQNKQFAEIFVKLAQLFLSLIHILL